MKNNPAFCSVLLYKEFGEQVVIYNVDSGETHLFDKLDAEILKAARENTERQRLVYLVLSSGCCFDEPSALGYVNNLFNQCEAAGLLESMQQG